jgi:hypothetical protein
MQPWTEAYGDIALGLAIIAAVTVFVVAPLLIAGARGVVDDHDNWTGADREED